MLFLRLVLGHGAPPGQLAFLLRLFDYFGIGKYKPRITSVGKTVGSKKLQPGETSDKNTRNHLGTLTHKFRMMNPTL